MLLYLLHNEKFLWVGTPEVSGRPLAISRRRRGPLAVSSARTVPPLIRKIRKILDCWVTFHNSQNSPCNWPVEDYAS